MTDLAQLWPAAGLHVHAGDVELRWIDDELLVQLAELAASGIHAPDYMPFTYPWSRGSREQVMRNVLAYQWEARQHVGPGKLVLEMAVLHRGVPVGVQAASGRDYSVLRSVETGSWLAASAQGQGLGTMMRTAMLHLLFDGLDAAVVASTAYADNHASNRVSLKTGYLPDGSTLAVRDGQAAVLNRYVMYAQRFEQFRDESVVVSGADAVRALL